MSTSLHKTGRALVTGALLALLPGCVMWNTGERIREKQVTYTGVDVSRPLGGLRYESVADVGFYYMQAPEVTYHVRTPLVQMPLLSVNECTSVEDVKETGKTCWVRVAATRDAKHRVPFKVVDSPPRDLTVSQEVKASPVSCAADMDVSSVSHDADYNRASLISLPCRYVVDPLLTVVSTAVAVPAIAVGSTAYGMWNIIAYPFKKAVRAVAPDKSADDGIPMPVAPIVTQ